MLMTIHQDVSLSAPAHELWASGELLVELGIPDDRRTRVEIIGGEIVVSPMPTCGHGGIVGDVADALTFARFENSAYPWRCAQNADFNLERIADGYIPDLVVLDEKTYRLARKAKARFLTPGQIELAVEVTSRSNAEVDRAPGPQGVRNTKWNGCAFVNVPWYLLIDRDPRRLGATLYSKPDLDQGAYTMNEEWAFGETIVLPEPFGVEIPTDGWQPWVKA